jgi:Protein of unknown function (DUF3761)
MRLRTYFLVVAMGMIFAAQAGIAQAPAGAPVGSTGQCNDGTYSTNATKRGACRGHQGVKTWFAASASPSAATAASTPTPQPPAAPAPAPTPSAPATKAMTKSASTGTAAPGGGPGMVWLNTSTNVYHCYGTRYYGTTKAGKYLTEAQAKAAGAHADANKPCGQ